MNSTAYPRARRAMKYRALLGTASLLALASMMPAQAQQVAQTQTAALPESVVVTGSLIRGAAAVGVPVTALSDRDFKETGALTVSDLLKDVPGYTVLGSLTVTNSGNSTEGGQEVRIHGLGGARELLMIDGIRYPDQAHGGCIVDPSIIPQLAVQRVDLLADGASATYGSDAIAGVTNLILRRGYDGAITQLRYSQSTDVGGPTMDFSQLFGRKWDSGDITVTYETSLTKHVNGDARWYNTYDFSLVGLDNRTPLTSAMPGIVTVGKPTSPKNTPSGFTATMGTTCSNCYSIPKGQNGVGLTWAKILANPGVGNEYNPYNDAWALPDQHNNSAVLTFDQDIAHDLLFIKRLAIFVDGFYMNRRVLSKSDGVQAQNKNGAEDVSVPTANPYYPIGAPAGLQVNYNFESDLPSYFVGVEIAERWRAGFNLDLPDDWTGNLSWSDTEDQEGTHFTDMLNPNMVSAALGNIVPAIPASGNTPGQATFTKPANIPYLNVFCDASVFQCNSPSTLDYIRASRYQQEKQIIQEGYSTFDGPLFDLPGGTVRAAIGGDYESHNIFAQNEENDITPSTATPVVTPDTRHFSVWAFFAQLNVPLVGEANSLPFVKSLELEISGRYDRYTDVGSTKNPKIAANWNLGYGVLLRGSWGTSFRAPALSETSTTANATFNQINTAAGGLTDNTPTCPVLGVPAAPGSVAAVLNPTCSGAENLLYPGGLSFGGGEGAVAFLRPPGYHLGPENATNWTGGFDFSPTAILKGLDVYGTLYHIRINNVLASYPTGTGLDDPIGTPTYILDTNPNWSALLAAALASPRAPGTIIASNVKYILDGATRNIGWQQLEGTDFGASYDWDMGGLGAGNVGIVGNYAIDSQRQAAPGLPVIDVYHQNPGDASAKDSGGRLNYRARLGWAGGEDNSWSLTGFMNYHAHVNSDSQALPPACFMEGNTPCDASGLPEFAQYTQQYALLTNFEPAFITFDLSIGYNTGDRPANDYLKNLSFQLTINDITNRQPPFDYVISTNGGNPSPFNKSFDPMQRTAVFVVTKDW